MFGVFLFFFVVLVLLGVVLKGRREYVCVKDKHTHKKENSTLESISPFFFGVSFSTFIVFC